MQRGSLPKVPSLGYVIKCKKKKKGCNVHIMLLIYIYDQVVE